MASDVTAPYRVAIYAAPDPLSAWWARGSQWLGRCAWTGRSLPPPDIPGLDRALVARCTAEPRRYGWHATLKAPMRLASPDGLPALREALSALARDHRAFDLPDLGVARLGSFLALRPETPPPALGALADDCVRRLQPLAAPLGDAELARRRRAGLSAEEDALMLAWGYPWVLQKFRFHFSLTGSLDGVPEDAVTRLQQAATEHFAHLPPLRIDRLSLFVESAAGDDFRLLAQQPLWA